MDNSIRTQYETLGFTGGDLGLGSNPAIVVVDFQVGFTDPTQSSIASNCDYELKQTKKILNVARRYNIPVFFSVIAYDCEAEAGLWGKKLPSAKTLKATSPLTNIDSRLDVGRNEVVITKKFASCFSGTPFLSLLNAQNIDTIFIAGTSTSGCVRATAVDAISNGIIPIVIRDAVCDRFTEIHEMSLSDMEAKYADLLTTKEVMECLEGYYNIN